jgi:hypothetical protein
MFLTSAPVPGSPTPRELAWEFMGSFLPPLLGLRHDPLSGNDLVHRGSLGTFDTRPVIPTAASLVREGNWALSEFDQARPRSLLRDSDGQFHYSFFKRSAAGSSQRFPRAWSRLPWPW